jgi:hypothetical protein
VNYRSISNEIQPGVMRSQKREIQKVRIKNLYFKGFLNETGSLSAFIQHLIENML